MLGFDGSCVKCPIKTRSVGDGKTCAAESCPRGTVADDGSC